MKNNDATNGSRTMKTSHWLVSEDAEAVFCLLGLVVFAAIVIAGLLL